MINVTEPPSLRHLRSTPLNMLRSSLATIGRWRKPRRSQTFAECGKETCLSAAICRDDCSPVSNAHRGECKARLEAGRKCLLLAVSGYAKRLPSTGFSLKQSSPATITLALRLTRPDIPTSFRVIKVIPMTAESL